MLNNNNDKHKDNSQLFFDFNSEKKCNTPPLLHNSVWNINLKTNIVTYRKNHYFCNPNIMSAFEILSTHSVDSSFIFSFSYLSSY
jgi:hypothetical protein